MGYHYWMRWVAKHIWDIIWNAIASVIATGLLQWLADEFGVHPEDWVKKVLGEVWGGKVAPYAWWLILGAVALTIALLAQLYRRSKRPVPRAGLVERAEATLQAISRLAGRHRRIMPDHPGYRGPQTNEATDALYMRDYHETIAADVRSILAEASRAKMLDHGDLIYAREDDIVARHGVEELGRVLARVIANVKAGGAPPLPLEYLPAAEKTKQTASAVGEVVGQASAPEYTLMPEAAQQAYSVMRKTGGKLLAFVEEKIAEREDKSPLPVCADKLVGSWGLNLYGQRWRSSERELIGPNEWFSVEFSADAASLISTHDARKVWVDLVVKADDLPSFLDAIREERTGELLNRHFVPIREGAKLAFEEVQSTPVAEFIRMGQENDPEAKLDWMIRYFLDLDPPPELTAIERPSAIAVPVSYALGRPKLVSGTNKLEIRGRILDETRISVTDVARAIHSLKKSVFS